MFWVFQKRSFSLTTFHFFQKNENITNINVNLYYNVYIFNCSFIENPLGGATIHNAQIEYSLNSNNSDLVSNFSTSTFALK